ncbi:hypothetical protein TNCV_1024911 [Trichonephila clavipes]|nr:hypothetical protein TNCV_1024911 [Trichonephila clavipes]
MSRFGGLSEERPSVFKTPSKLGTHLSIQCSGDERQSRPCPALPLVTYVEAEALRRTACVGLSWFSPRVTQMRVGYPPCHRVRRRKANFIYEARDDPIEDPTLKYKTEFYFFTLDKVINALESSLPSAVSSRNRDSSLHATHFQSSTLKSMCSLAQKRRAALWRALSSGTLGGRWLPKSIL